jgi:hypothetical protein
MINLILVDMFSFRDVPRKAADFGEIRDNVAELSDNVADLANNVADLSEMSLTSPRSVLIPGGESNGNRCGVRNLLPPTT